MMDNAYVDSTVEALILASPEPLPARKIGQVVQGVTVSRVAAAVAHLNDRYAQNGSSFRIREIAGGYQHYVMPEYVSYVEELFSRQRKLRLTKAALETAAIVAYRQPVTKTEIERVRGVASDGVVQNLLEKNMITITGRASTVGKPLQYGTTNEFLKFFGLNSLDDLPKMSEIEELVVAQDNKSQTELELAKESERTGTSQKLNVADGTYDPQHRKELAEADVESEDESHITPPGVRLVLKSPPESDELPGSAEDATETTSATTETDTVENPEQAV